MSDAIDRLEITEVLNRHQIYIDLADAEGYARLYAPDGAYESPFASATGRADIAKMFRNLGASGFTANKRNFIGPIMIEVKQDRAIHCPIKSPARQAPLAGVPSRIAVPLARAAAASRELRL